MPHAAPTALIAELRAALADAGLKLPAAAPPTDSRLARSEPAVRSSGAELAARIDHTLLAPDATARDIRRLCEQANRHAFFSVCVNPLWVGRAAAAVRAPVRVCSVAGFPLGAGATEVRAREAARAVQDGAHEVDLVVLIGRLRDALPDGGRLDERALREVQADIAEVVVAVAGASSPVPARERRVKLILETCLLDARQKIAGALLAAGAGADFVKTSTGSQAGGATEDDVRLLRAVLGPGCGIKASGGIRTREAALALLAAGADRLGCSASVAIISGG